MNNFRRYFFQPHQTGSLWLPISVLCLFIIVVGFFGTNLKAVEVSAAYTGVVLPLIGGILGAFATLDDSILELKFASPLSTFFLLISQFIAIVAVLALCSLIYQMFALAIHLDMNEFGNLWQRQFSWIIPSLALTSLGFLGAYWSANANSAAMIVGMIWIIQVIAREWFIMTPPVKYVFLFTGALYPHALSRAGSQLSLLGLSAIFLVIAWLILKKQERFI